MAATNHEDGDPAVAQVTDGGEGGRARSTEPTPPPSSSQGGERLAETLAKMVARGEAIPVITDDDTLLSGGEGGSPPGTVTLMLRL